MDEQWIWYPFQRKVAERLLSGQNVILQAPTGAGKTYAALLPFLEAQKHNLEFPKRCIYSVPMRALANQFAVSELGRRFGARIQTGEHSEDPEFRASTLTFATIDQVLSSFLMRPYSLSYRRANLNAGAVASSYLVFDEFHLFEPRAMLPTTLEMLRILRGVAPFLLMTATFSSDMLTSLAGYLQAAVVPETPEEMAQLQALPSQNRVRRYHVAEHPLDAEAVLAQHKGRTIVICNTVERAQRLYMALKKMCTDPIILLHARFIPEDRARLEGQLRALFSRGAPEDARAIAVATQAIEVGLDITCDVLHTELAPANAILQRAGRCARYPGETGDVYVYRCSAVEPSSESVDLLDRVAPYATQKKEIALTWEYLKAYTGEVYTFAKEQECITAVHGATDQRILEGIKGSASAHRRNMNACWLGEKGAVQLVRDVASFKVVIHDDPYTVAERPYAYVGFSLHIGVIRRMIKQWLERLAQESLESAGVWGLREITPEEQESPLWDACLITAPEEMEGFPIFVVHPTLAYYDGEIGFWPYERGTFRSQAKEKEVEEREQYAYCLEPYLEHARRVWQAYRGVWPSLSLAARRLEARAGWPEGTLDRLAEATALLHDVGKLNIQWQKWVRQYQRLIGRPVVEGYYAHTDSDPSDLSHVEAARQVGKRPAHAVESAVALVRLLEEMAGDFQLCRAAFSAIARHHGAFTTEMGSFHLVKGSRALLESLLREAGLSVPHGEWLCFQADPVEYREEVKGLFINPEYDDALVAYMLLVRALRLADQEGTGGARKEGKEEAM